MTGSERAENEVVVLGLNYPDSFAENIASSLRDLGIATALVDPTIRYAKPGTMARFTRSRRYVNEAVSRFPRVRDLLVTRPVGTTLAELDPQLVISTWGYFEPDQVERWRRGTPRAVWVLWYPDAISNLGRQQMFDAPYDYLFFKDCYLVDLLARRTQLPVHLLPQACNPARHRTEEPSDEHETRQYQCDVAVVGNMYPYRALILDQIPQEFHTRIYGNLYTHVAARHPWLADAYTGEYVTGRAKALAFRGAKVALNTVHYAELQGVNLRLFEATGCGAFVLSHSTQGLEEYYELGRELAVFETPAQLRSALAYYLANNDERAAISRAGQARAHRDHTYEARFRRMFAVCGIEPGSWA